jgi:plastocyanin
MAEFGKGPLMRVPRILFGLPLLLAGIFLPAAGSEPAKPPQGAIGMTHEGFTSKSVVLHAGQALTMVNSSRWVHIVGPGRDGRILENTAVPTPRVHLMETNDSYTTGKWTIPGTYYVTCSVHPEMTIKVVVTGCCCANDSCA